MMTRGDCGVSVGRKDRPALSLVPIVSKYELPTTRVTVFGPEATASASAPSILNSRCCENDPASGAADAIDAFVTVGSALTRSITSVLNCLSRSGGSCAKFGDCSESTFPRSNPGLTAYRLMRLRISSPAPMRSMNDAASWLTTSSRCARRRPRLPAVRPPEPIDCTGSAMNVSRGAHAKSSARAVDMTIVNASTRVSSATSPARVVNRCV